MPLVSQRAYGRHRNVSHTAVQKAITTGRIILVRGKIDTEQADRDWDLNTDPSKPSNTVTGNPKHRRAPDAPSTPMDLDTPGRTGGSNRSGRKDGGNGSAGDYSKARAAREVYQAQLAKLDLDERMGLLVRADEVRVAAFNAARMARDQLMAIPERLATTLAATTDPIETQHILEDEFERICQEMSSAHAKRD
jgi:hypothetical protein